MTDHDKLKNLARCGLLNWRNALTASPCPAILSINVVIMSMMKEGEGEGNNWGSSVIHTADTHH